MNERDFPIYICPQCGQQAVYTGCYWTSGHYVGVFEANLTYRCTSGHELFVASSPDTDPLYQQRQEENRSRRTSLPPPFPGF